MGGPELEGTIEFDSRREYVIGARDLYLAPQIRCACLSPSRSRRNGM